jgi:CMP-N,N'-diacetyllegionaminic acid synthase
MIALIPAKKSSTRLKNKNLKILNGKPLIYFSIVAALKSKYITRVIVSTDSQLIAKKSLSFGAEVPFIRPKAISKKDSSIKDVCNHALRFLEKKEKIKVPEIMILQPTSPLRTTKDIDDSIRLYQKETKTEYLTSFTKTKPFEWLFYKRGKKFFYQISKKKIKNSQYLDQAYILTGSIYIMSRKIIFGKKFDFKKVVGIEIPNERSIDIDNANDFSLAESYLFKKI